MSRRSIFYKVDDDVWYKTYCPDRDVPNGTTFRVIRSYHEFEGDPAENVSECIKHQFLSSSDGTIDFVASDENRIFLESFGHKKE